MEPTNTPSESVSVSVERSDLGELGMLLEWIIDNRTVMDESMTHLRSEEILPSINKWIDIVQSNI